MTRLQELIARHAGDGVTPTALPGVSVMAGPATTEPIGALAEPALAVVAQGSKRTVLGDVVYEYGAGEYLVVSVDLPVTSHVTRATAAEPFLAVGLVLRPAAIAALLLEAAAVAATPAGLRAAPPADAPARRPAGIAVSRAAPDLLDALARLLGLLDRPRDAAVLGPAYEREILWRLITGEQGAMVRQIGLADSRLSQVGRAIAWIRSHYDQPL